MNGLELARKTITERHPAASWYRAAAIVLRQELERSLDRLWARSGVAEAADCPARTQLVALPYYLGDDALAGQVRFAWHRLSTYCHAGAYEVPVTADELDACATIVQRLVDLLDAETAP